MIRKCYLTALAYPISNDKSKNNTINSSKSFCKKMNWELVYSDLLDKRLPQGSPLSINDRINDFEKALKCDYIWSARGGYGSIELLDKINLPNNPPPIIGYSDISIMHAIWWKKVESYYAFMPAAAHSNTAVNTLKNILNGDSINFNNNNQADVSIIKQGSCKAPIFASCLRVLTSLCGTNFFPDLENTILAIEDIDEMPYSIDRDLFQLYASGKLNKIKGLILGKFPTENKVIGISFKDIAKKWSNKLNCPCIMNFQFGHDDDPISIPVGRECSLLIKEHSWYFDIHKR